MNLEAIYETDLWRQLEKNPAFNSRFNEVLNLCRFDVSEQDLRIAVRDNKLILAYRTKIKERDYNCQCQDERQFEFFLDSENNLIVNEKYGSLHSNYGYGFSNSDGGILDTHYSCEAYDPDGVELAFQGYSDSYTLNKESFDVQKNGFNGAINGAFNPNLESYANSGGVYLKPNIIGESARFYRQIRSKDNLGIVVNSSCVFNKNGMVENPKEEFFFNSFLSHHSAMHPEKICVIRPYPFATVDEDKIIHFNEIYEKSGLTLKNFRDVAKNRFLKELIEEKEQTAKYASSDVMQKYDMMIEKLEGKSNERTM